MSVFASIASVALGQVADVDRSSVVPSNIAGSTRYVGLEHVDSGGRIESTATVESEGLKSSKFRFSTDHVLYGKLRPYLRKVSCPEYAGVCSTDIIPIRPGPRLDRRYLYHWLRTDDIVSLSTSRSSGANLPRLSPKELVKFHIPLPPLPEQKRIAGILDAADGLRAKRRAALAQLDTLLQSTFLDLFGDPVTNPKGWEKCSLGDHGTFKNGLNFKNGESGEEVRSLGVGSFKSFSRIDDMDTLPYVVLNSLPSKEYYLKDGDVVFVRSNGNRALVGRCVAIYPGESRVTFSGFCIRYRIQGDQLLPVFVAHLFRAKSFKSLLFSGGQGANIQNINQKILNSLPVPLPPFDLQRRFATIVESVERQKARHSEHLAQLDTLFASLQQRAFKGEL